MTAIKTDWRILGSVQRCCVFGPLLVSVAILSGCSGLGLCSFGGDGHNWRYFKVYSRVELNRYDESTSSYTMESYLAQLHTRLAEKLVDSDGTMVETLEDNLYVIKLLRGAGKPVATASWIMEHYVKCSNSSPMMTQKRRVIDAYKSFGENGTLFCFDMYLVTPQSCDRYSNWLSKNSAKRNQIPVVGYDCVSETSYMFMNHRNEQSTAYGLIFQLISSGVPLRSIVTATGLPEAKVKSMLKAFREKGTIELGSTKNEGWIRFRDGKLSYTKDRLAFSSFGDGSECLSIEPDLKLEPLPYVPTERKK